MESGNVKRLRVLIVATEMIVGGVSSALLGLLRCLDYTRLDVDLLLYENNAPLQSELPPQVNILPEAIDNSPAAKLRKYISPSYILRRVEAKKLAREGKPIEDLQVRSRNGAHFTKALGGEYDLAISFIEFWPLYYTAEKIKARHKLAWIHVDYKTSTLNVRRDEAAFPAYDRIIAVSEECAENLRELSPKFAEKAAFLPNLVSEEDIRSRASRPASTKLPSLGGIRLVTTARLQLAHKGLDRGVRAFARLLKEGLLTDVTWSIIGGGKDEAVLRGLIDELGCAEHIHLLGQQLEPLPIMAQADAFLMTSHYEGKPIAVTEAQILGLPVIATRYASAEEQITHEADGLIVENSENGIEAGLRRLATEPELLEKLREGTRARHYGNEADVELYYELFRSLGLSF